MALIKCKECSHGVSTKAKSCPHCGAPVKYTSTSTKIIAGIFIIMIILCSIGGFFDDSSPSKSTTSYTSTKSSRAKPSPIKSTSARKWYDGGNLHKAGALDWQKADYHNKMATCADFITGLWQSDDLNPELNNAINIVDDIKPYARELVVCLDAAFAKDPNPQMNYNMFANQTVGEFSVMCMLTMGWIK